ncbi:hypothetical protein Bbelb_334000 [Branchiostoma belcheri]|nr:hypothetical protein Bbelb_334000 [Branchiostoma belcheri]
MRQLRSPSTLYGKGHAAAPPKRAGCHPDRCPDAAPLPICLMSRLVVSEETKRGNRGLVGGPKRSRRRRDSAERTAVWLPRLNFRPTTDFRPSPSQTCKLARQWAGAQKRDQSNVIDKDVVIVIPKSLCYYDVASHTLKGLVVGDVTTTLPQEVTRGWSLRVRISVKQRLVTMGNKHPNGVNTGSEEHGESTSQTIQFDKVSTRVIRNPFPEYEGLLIEKSGQNGQGTGKVVRTDRLTPGNKHKVVVLVYTTNAHRM